LIVPLLIALAYSVSLSAAELDQELASLMRSYDAALYDSPSDEAKRPAFAALSRQADKLAQQHPMSGESRVVKGLVQAELSGVELNLTLAKQARETLEASLAITPNTYAADAYTMLGSLYSVLPSFPISFGDNKKARECFLKALAINPSGLSPNLNYAQLLFKQDDYTGALKYATTALAAPPRLGREKADKAERTRAEILVAKAKGKLHA
jgi:tetratricopeptide (TPR) repeat protein